jgi:hypothetical protein
MSAISTSWWRVLLFGLIGLLSLATVRAQTPAQVPGRIVAAQVHGAVTVAVRGGAEGRALRDGEALAQDAVVTTAPGASVVLVFSNGATVALGSDSSLSIDAFLQEPFGPDDQTAAQTEPSTSRTRLHLSRGELVGNVKHLRLDRGSSFTVDTAVGAAGIRGTVFRLVIRPTAGGQVLFSLSTDQGEVALQGLNVPAVSVAAGREVRFSFEATVDPTTGELTVTAIPAVEATTPISAESQAAIATAALEIARAVQQVVVPSPGTTGTSNLPKSDSSILPVLPPNSPSQP